MTRTTDPSSKRRGFRVFSNAKLESTMRTRIQNWAHAILVIPKWLLTVKYALFVLFAIITGFAGAPSLGDTAGDQYAFVWSIALVLSAFTACVASGFDTNRAEQVEKWAAVALVALLSAYLTGAISLVSFGHLSRAATSVLLLIVTLLPAARATALILAASKHKR